MRKTAKSLGIYFPVLFLALISSVVLRTVACFTELDYASGYFDGKLCINIANWIVIGAALLFFTHIFTGSKINRVASFNNAPTYIPAGAVSVALIFVAAEMVHKVALKPGAFLSLATLFNSTNLLILAIAALAVACTMNFFFNAFFAKKENTTRAAFGIVVSIFLAAYAAYLYVDTALPLNAPNKIVDEMAFLFSALFFIYETRISLGRGKWRPYIAFGLIASLLSAYSSVPTIILYIAKGEIISDSIAAAVLMLTFCIFITARVLLVAALKDDEKAKTVEAIEKMAELRKEELENNARARDIINMEENVEGEGTNYAMDIPEETALKEPQDEPTESDDEKAEDDGV